jgi:hypothetical protein
MISWRELNIFALVLAAALLAGCAGYHLGPVMGEPAGDRSVEVLPFNNQTLQPRLGDALTQAVRERLQTDGTFHLDTRGTGDIVVSGTITRYGREALSFLNTDSFTPENYRVGMVVHVVARERSSGKLLFDKDLKGYSLIHAGADLTSADRQALPLLAQDLARNLVSLLAEDKW